MVNDKHMKLSCKMQLINRNLILTIVPYVRGALGHQTRLKL